MKTNDRNLLPGQAPGVNSHSSPVNKIPAGNPFAKLAGGARSAQPPARIRALLLFLVPAGLAVLSAKAQPTPPTFRPQQAVVFDGSVQANSVSLVAFSNNGFLCQIGRLVTCDQPDLPERILRTTLPESGLTTIGDVPAMSGYEILPLGPGPLPVPLADDCDVLAAFSSLDPWIQSICSSTDLLLENAVNCQAGHVITHCQILKAVENAILLPGNAPVAWSAWIAPTPANPGLSAVIPCQKTLQTLSVCKTSSTRFPIRSRSAMQWV
jgi:hypothetical protein